MDRHEDFVQRTLPAMDMVHNIARRAVPTAEDAKDLVQDTYLAAYRAWSEGRRPRTVEPWLATICLNLARDRHRSRARRPTEVPIAEIGAMSASGRSPEEQALSAVEGVAVHRALWSLPEEQRIAISLVDLADLSVADAARIMGTPKGTVLSRLHRGRRSLARALGGTVDGMEP